MTYKIQLYTEEMEPEVKAFNNRLKEGNASFCFPERYVSDRWPRIDDGRRIFEDYYLVIENNGKVRGGYILKSQDFIFDGKVKSIGNIQLPLSEGAVNKAYNILGIKIVNDALDKKPLLFALGMGGVNKPFPRLLKSLGWNLVAIPFYFKIFNPKIFFRNIKILRKSMIRNLLFDLIAFSGLGWICLKCLNLLKKRIKINEKVTYYEEVQEFGEWVDELWQKADDNLLFCAVRNKKTLNILYPNDNLKFIRLKITIENEIAGWVLLLVTSMSDHHYFGNMRVGSIIDCLSINNKAADVFAVTEKYFKRNNVDLIISNQSHSEYQSAFIENGFLKGPSNLIFATSRQLTKALGLNDGTLVNVHINRGDGDGPMHL